jgi:hypothetical protein
LKISLGEGAAKLVVPRRRMRVAVRWVNATMMKLSRDFLDSEQVFELDMLEVVKLLGGVAVDFAGKYLWFYTWTNCQQCTSAMALRS